MLSSSYDAAVERAITSANEAWIARPPARMTPRFPTVTSKGLRGANWRLALADIYPALRREGLALEEQSSDVYEFGVASGGSLELLRSIFGRTRLIGFDTFTGLPDYPNEEQVKLWTPGRFSPMGVRRNTSTAHEGAAAVRRWLNGRLGRGRVGELEFVVDCDFYGATLTALRFLFRHGLIVPGTLIGYDDWWTTACAVHRGAVDIRRQPSQPTRARLLVGEWRAHAKVAKEFNATLRCVAGSCRGPYDRYSRVDLFNQYAPIFLVTSVGAATASASRSPGLTSEGSSDGAGALYDDPKLLDNLLNHWPVCLHQGKRHRVEK